MKLYFIRHTTVDIPKGICYGQSNVALQKSFPQEADQILQQIKNIPFDAIFTSPLHRCVALAHYCGYPNAILDARLKELNFGDWEMQAWDNIKDPHLQNWYNDWLTTPATNGESFYGLYERFKTFITELPTTAQTIAIFTHGGIINCARIYAGKATFDTAFNATPNYGSITELDILL